MLDQLAVNLLVGGVAEGIKSGRILLKEGVSFKSAYNSALDQYSDAHGRDEIYGAMFSRWNAVRRRFFFGDIHSDDILHFAQYVAQSSAVDPADTRIDRMISLILENLSAMRVYRKRILNYQHFRISEETHEYTKRVYHLLEQNADTQKTTDQPRQMVEDGGEDVAETAQPCVRHTPESARDEGLESPAERDELSGRPARSDRAMRNLQCGLEIVAILLLLVVSISTYADKGDSLNLWLRGWIGIPAANRAAKAMLPFVLTLPFAFAMYLTLHLFGARGHARLSFFQIGLGMLQILFAFYTMNWGILRVESFATGNKLAGFCLAYFSFVLSPLAVGLTLFLRGLYEVRGKYGRKVAALQLLPVLAMVYVSVGFTFATARWSFIGIWQHTHWFWREYAVVAIYLVNVTLLAAEAYLLANAAAVLWPRSRFFQSRIGTGFAYFGNAPHDAMDRVCGAQTFVCGVLSLAISAVWIWLGLAYTGAGYHPRNLQRLFRLLPILAIPLGIIALVQAWKYTKWNVGRKAIWLVVAGVLLALAALGASTVYLVIGKS